MTKGTCSKCHCVVLRASAATGYLVQICRRSSRGRKTLELLGSKTSVGRFVEGFAAHRSLITMCTSTAAPNNNNNHNGTCPATMAPPSFTPPTLLTARKSSGFVDMPGAANEFAEEWTGRKSKIITPLTEAPPSPEKSFGPSLLQRAKTMAGNIVVLEEDGNPPRAYWLSRKIGKSSKGVTRLGYELRPNSKPEFKDSHEAWEIAMEENGEDPILVIVQIMHSSVLDMDNEGGMVHRPVDELSALQMIAKHKSPEEGHVVATRLVGTCSSHVYAILPYHRDGTLMQYCLENGSLDESVARFFFRQILQVRKKEILWR